MYIFGVIFVINILQLSQRFHKNTSGNTSLWIGPLLTGTCYLNGR